MGDCGMNAHRSALCAKRKAQGVERRAQKLPKTNCCNGVWEVLDLGLMLETLMLKEITQRENNSTIQRRGRSTTLN